jgi:hypothetical protein
MKTIKRIYKTLDFAGGLNHYWGCEPLTVWDYVWRKRISFDTAWSLAKLIYP